MHLKGANICEALPRFSLKTSVLKLMTQAMEHNADKVAQIEDATGKTYTYADILQQSKSISSGLKERGINSGDYVVLSCRKSCLAFAVELGIMFRGAIPVLVHVRSASEIYKYTSKHVIKAIFCEKIDLQSVNRSINQMNPEPVLVASVDVDDPIMKSLLLPRDEFSLYEVKDIKKQVVLVMFTSGTTSDPKGVQISDLGLQRLGYSLSDENIESYLLISPFSWISCTISLVASILKGYSLVLSEAKDPSTHFKIIEKYRVNGWTVFSGNMNLYVKEPTLSSVDLSSLTAVNIGGAVVKRRTVERFVSEVLKGRVGVHVVYGMTEIGIITTWQNPLDFSKADSSGCLAPGVEVKVTDEEGNLVDPGSIGEIRARSLSTMVGYWDCPELNAESFDSNGFFRTGDAGYFDNEGFLFISGRASDIVAHGESKVSISEIEDLLTCHSTVLDAGVVAKRLSDVQKLIAFVVVKPGCQISGTEITEFLSEQSTSKVRLGAVHEVSTIPRTQTNKIHRGLLQSMADKLYT